MTETVLRQIVQQAVRNGSFRARLRSDAAAALAGFDLTADERSALASGDPEQLTALGVDRRMSKAFTVGFFDDASKMVVSDDTSGATPVLVDEGSDGSVTVGDPTAETSESTDAAPSFAATHLRMIEQDLDTDAALDATATHGPTHLQMIEQDLDTGGTDASLTDTSAADTPSVIDPGDVSISDS